MYTISYIRYTKEMIEEKIKDVYSFAELVRRFGKAPVGGNICHMKKKCDIFGIDYSHFIGKASNKGKVPVNKKSADEILVFNENVLAYRAKRSTLKRAMLEKGVEYICYECGINNWNGKEIILPIDHIDGNYRNNILTNLRFMCPNCHSQTDTWCKKK